MRTNRRLEETFRTLVCSGRIEELVRRRSTCNLPMPTAGGSVCWETIESQGWKLQTNLFFGNWRILDPANIRRACGVTREQLESFLADRPVSVISNYSDAGYEFLRYPARGNAACGTAFLLHGWGVRAKAMEELALYLSENGYDVLNYDYPTSEKSIADHAECFLALYRIQTASGPRFILTHSMGGLVFRTAMSRMTEAECREISAFVMLGPPNRGSFWATFGDNAPARAVNASLGDMSLCDGSYVRKIPAPAFYPPTGIIAGAYDGKVAYADTVPPEGWKYERIRLDCTHPGLRNPDNTGASILRFFREKRF